MADERQPLGEENSGLVQEFMAQFRRIAQQMEEITGLSGAARAGLPSFPGLPGWPAPGALSAAQLKSIAAGITAQRRSIDALKTQLTAFDEQLAVLEQILEPLAAWARTWAELESRLTGGAIPPPPHDHADGR
ncbi:MAG: hypothetical protein ACLQDY_05880 [Streptosporangiaceae bacterium]